MNGIFDLQARVFFAGYSDDLNCRARLRDYT